jgi:hypothetical protein
MGAVVADTDALYVVQTNRLIQLFAIAANNRQQQINSQ